MARRTVHTNDDKNYTNIYLNILADCNDELTTKNTHLKGTMSIKVDYKGHQKHVNWLIIVLQFYDNANPLSF